MDQRQGRIPVGEPEILPPGEMPQYRYQEEPPAPLPPPRRRSGWQIAPATYILTGINIAVYVLMVLSGVSPLTPRGDQLVHWGANVGLFVLAAGDVDVRSLRDHSHRHEHVVPVQPGASG
jgi:rhomboid protease GluP